MDRSEITELVEREAWEDVVAYLDTHWVELTHSNREVLAYVLNALPPSVAASNARLTAAREYANFIPARGPARPTRYQHAPGNTAGLLDHLAQLTSQSAGARMGGRFDEAVLAAKAALRLLRESPAPATRAIRHVLPDLRLQWAISLQLGAQVPEAIRVYERAYDEALRHGNTRIAVEAAGTIAFDFAYLGMPTHARQWLARVPDHPRTDSDTVHEMPALATALLLALELDLDGARRALLDAPATSSETWAMRFAVESFISSLDGHTDSFSAKLLAVRAARPDALGAGGLNALLLALASAETALHARDSDRADADFDHLASVSRGLPPGIAQVLQAWRAISRDDIPLALAVASRPLVEGTASPGIAAELRAALTVVHLRNDHVEEAAAQFRACVEIVSAERVFHVLHRFTPDERDRAERIAGEGIPEEARVALAAVPPRARRARRNTARLTPRELSVLRMLMDGRSRDEIAEAEKLSLNTIKTQIRSIYRKLDVNSRDGAVAAVLAAELLG